MTWTADGPQGNEVGKVRFDLVPYMSGLVLDLGCGPTKVYPTAVGIDNRLDAKLFGIRINPDIAVKSCESLPMFSDGAADTVFSSHLLEHIADYEAALSEWWRLVKPGGYLVLYLPHRDHYPRIGQPGANPDHKHDFHPDDIVSVMSRMAGEWELVENETRTAGVEYSFLQVYRKRIAKTGGNADLSRIKLRPKKTLGLVRLGAYGDALWITPALEYFKSEGYDITVYTQYQGEEMLRFDPNVDRFIVQPQGLFDFDNPGITIGQWQHAYWAHEARKFDRFVNAIGAVERRLLPQVQETDFYMPDEQRRRLMNRNYVEAVCEMLGVPFDRETTKQKFRPSNEEFAWALAERSRIDGPLVIINPSGSSVPKWWPYSQQLADMLAAERIHSRIVGDLRLVKFRPSGRYGYVIGTDLPIRKLLTLSMLADVVVGTESVVVNAVAHEIPLKIVLLSHSTHENLTRDWANTIAVEPEGLPCYPCHRIHADMTYCTHDREVNAAACQSAAKPELVLEHIRIYLGEKLEAA